jgi:MFS family permease
MARIAVTAVFGLNGVIEASWAARVPAVARHVDAGPGALGVALLGTSIGMIVAAPIAARLSARFGARMIVAISGVGCVIALPLLGLVSSVAWLGAALLLLGACIGTLDVSMNIAAVAVIRALDRPLMPVFHSAFSFGGLIGSLAAALAAAENYSPLRHFLIVAIAGLVLLAVLTRAVPTTHPAVRVATRQGPPPYRRKLLWFLAAIALCSAIAEGACANWLALFLVHDRGLADGLAATGYATFSLTMAISRLSGERLQRRWGGYRLLACGTTLACGGLLIAVLVPVGVAAYAGFALAGLGLAFGFPVPMELASAAGRRADSSGGERELGFVTTLAYSAFLGGPPVVGGIAQATNLAVAFGVVAVIVALSVPAVLGARHAQRAEAASLAE